MHIFQPVFVAQPDADFVIGDHDRTGAPGNGRGVADVIAMPVREQDRIGVQIVWRDDGQGIACQEWIDQNGVVANHQSESGMRQPRHLNRHRKSSLP